MSQPSVLSDRVRKQLVAARIEKDVVKFIIQVVHLSEVAAIDRACMPDLQVAQTIDEIARGGQGDELASATVQQRAHVVNLLDFAGREIADHGAPVTFAAHDSHRIKAFECSSNDMPGAAKASNEVVLDQSFARPEAAEDDFLLDLADRLHEGIFPAAG
ncbi:hypothetical protein ACSSV1_005610 [Labrenzia sp. MBR-25]